MLFAEPVDAVNVAVPLTGILVNPVPTFDIPKLSWLAFNVKSLSIENIVLSAVSVLTTTFLDTGAPP